MGNGKYDIVFLCLEPFGLRIRKGQRNISPISIDTENCVYGNINESG